MSTNEQEAPPTLEVFATEEIILKDVPPGGSAPIPQPLTEIVDENGVSRLTSNKGNFGPLTPLEVQAIEEVMLKDVPPGTQAAEAFKQHEENLPKEEIEKRQKIMLEYARLSGRYVEPHNIKSRWVTNDDLPRVLADGKDLVAMCNLPRGKYSGIAALAHPQIENKDPLRFFILPNGMVIINPVITSHTKAPVFKNEGCMSYPDEEIKKNVPRYNKITVTYQTLNKISEESEPVLSDTITETVNGGMSHVFQHECGHLNGCNIYDEAYDPSKSVLLGDGEPLPENCWIVPKTDELTTTNE